MTKITFLGTASAVPGKDHQNTHFIVETEERRILIDCVGNPIVRLEQADVDPLSITDLILTHFHPDHVSGMPLLLMDWWLLGRIKPIEIYGLHDVIDRAEQMMILYDWMDWLNFYPVNFHRLPNDEQMVLIDDQQLKVWASPVCHMIPGIGIKFKLPEAVLVYSSDTGPCDAVVLLAYQADILIHEATGSGNGHSSPEQAGQIAERAEVKRLFLIHYPPQIDTQEWAVRAKRTFSGDVIVAEDLMKVVL